MNCKSCQYPLWNLPGRACPECGAPFLPSLFEFVPNSIRFCCPHCRTTYYGTDAKGHLVPSAFVCVGCSQPISMDVCVLLPTQGVAEEQTKPEMFPWFQPGKRWRIGSWATMMVRALFMPDRLAKSIPPEAPMGFLFALGTTTVTQWGSILIFMIPPLFMAAGQARGMMVAVGWMLLMIAGGAVSNAVALILWIIVAHGVLLITGGTTQGIRRTGHAFCYTAPALLPSGIPCLGFYLGLVLMPWWCVSASFALANTQSVNIWRALAAVAVLPLVVIGVVVLLILAAVYF